MAIPKIISDIRGLKTQIPEDISTHNTSADAHNNRFTEMLDVISKTSRYNLLAGVRNNTNTATVTTNPIPTSGWSTITQGRIYSNGDYMITANSYMGTGYLALQAVDNNLDSAWASSQTTSSTFMLKLPSAILVTKMKLKIFMESMSFSIQGSNTGSNVAADWTVVYSGGTNLNDLTEITITSPGMYQYYRIVASSSITSVTYLYDLQISAYSVQVASIAYTLSDIDDLQDDQRLLIETPSIDNVGVESNTLNSIPIDMILKSSTKYELVYKSNNFYAREVI